MKSSTRMRRHVCAILALTMLLSYLPHSTYLIASASALESAARLPGRNPHSATPEAEIQARGLKSYGSLPLSFEKNTGQADPAVKFLVRGAAGTTFLTDTEAVFVLRGAGSDKETRGTSGEKSLTTGQRRGSVRMRSARREKAEASNSVVRLRFVGASAGAASSGLSELPGKVNYFRGHDARKWVADVPTFARVRYEDIYPGVDLVYYGNRRELEYDFEVAPGANPDKVELNFEGADGISVEGETGDLLVSVGGKVLRQRKPVVYQEVEGERRAVPGSYTMKGGGRVGFALGEYDRSNRLVIDPVISYSSYLGGLDEDLGHDVAVDADGNAYIVGSTGSVDFPVKNAVQSSNHGSCECGAGDAFIAKMNASGSALEWATYLGGHDEDVAFGVAVDSARNVVITGLSYSVDFPVKNAMQSANGSFDPACPDCDYITSDAFVAKVAAAGNKLTFSTLLGGVEGDGGRDVAVDADGDIYVAGFTGSFDFPTTDPVQTYLNGARTLADSRDTCCEGDAFLTKIASDGQTRVYSTFVGGALDDAATGVAVDTDGGAYITGLTHSTQFDPTATPSPTPTPEPPNRIQEFTLPKPRSAPYAIAAGPDGNLWFTEINAARIGRITPAGAFTEYEIPSGTTANDITAGPDGNIWFTERDNAVLGRIVPSTGAVAEFPVNATSPPNGITAGPEGSLWFTEQLNGPYIGRFTPPATSATPPPTPTGDEFSIPSGNTATRITRGPDNNLWFTEFDVDLFGRALPSPTPVFDEFTNSASGNGGIAITAGPDGNLWYTGKSQPVLGRLVPPSPSPSPSPLPTPMFTEYAIPSGDPATFIALGPDGKLWFTENAGSKIGNITPSASPSPTPINELHTPTSNSGPNGITAGPDGNIWFAETRVNKIGRYALNPATPLPTPAPSPSPTPQRLFPTTPGAFQEQPAGTGFSEDAFVTKLNPSGSGFEYSTFIGGGGDEESLGIAVGADRTAYVTGYTNSPAGGGGPCEESSETASLSVVAAPTPGEYPTTENAYQNHNNGGDDCDKLLEFSGEGGTDAFLTRLNAGGSALIYSTYIGGSGNEGFVGGDFADTFFDGADIAVDFQGNAYITGETASTNFPVKDAFKPTAGGDDPAAEGGGGDAYVAKFDTNASGDDSLVYSSYLGGSFFDVGYGIAVDSAANAYVTGFTVGTVVCTRTELVTPGHPENGTTCVEVSPVNDFPTTQGAFQPVYRGYFAPDAFITKIGGGSGGTVGNPAFSVVGRVTGPGGGGGGGVTITVTQGDTVVATTTTDAEGFYTVNGLAPGSYVVTPSGGGNIFSPPNQQVSITNQNVRADFTATRVFTISGRVVEGSNGLGGVTITVTKPGGSEVATTTTDDGGNYQVPNLPQGDYVVTPSKAFYAFAPPSRQVQELTSDQTGVDFAATLLPGAIQFSVVPADIARNEGDGKFLVKVTRSGNAAAPASVVYATHDGSAFQRSDYTVALGVLRFAAGETEKTIPIFIVDDAFQEAGESLTMTLSTPTGGATLGEPSTLTLTIVDNDTSPATAANNPIDNTAFFVRQHYLDFLNREPDPTGLAFWVSGIESCGADAGCREVKRVETSAAFFLSIEFQQTGYLIYRLYRGPLSRQPGYLEFMRDSQEISRGLVVGAPGWEQQLDAGTQRFAEEFVTRPEFVARFPVGTEAGAYVDALYTSEGVTPSAAEREQAVAAYGGGDVPGRARALRVVANNQTFTQRLLNEGFVASEYFGYLRRSPDDPGFNFWLNKLNSFNGDFRKAEMVRAFISSDEYRKRFGQ
jgi:streptogramin lyase